MGFFGLMKKRLKKRFRVHRRWLALGMLALAAGLAWIYATSEGKGTSWNGKTMSVFSAGAKLPASPAELEREAAVTVRRLYVCGEEAEPLGVLPPDRVAALASAHPEWEFAAAEDGTVVFTEHVDDLSAACKKNAYIGVDAAGSLTLYEGPPREAKAVKTFFQLNVEHLESALPDDVVTQLREGIRITDLADYNSVLSTFSDFAIDETEKVMKPEA